MAAELYYTDSVPALSSNAYPVPGALLNFYLTETSTREPIYADAALTTEHTNPVVANSAGRFPPIYAESSVTFRVVPTDAEGVPLGDERDPYVFGTVYTGAKGDPGGDASAIGLFTSAAGMTIATGIDAVKTTGHQSAGKGAAFYAEFDEGSGAANDAYVTANPRTAFKSSNGRYFRLSLDQTITPFMFGCLGGSYVGYTGANEAVELQAFFDFLADNDVPNADWTIDVRCDPASSMKFGPATGIMKTRKVCGDIFMWSLAYQSEAFVDIRNLPNFGDYGGLKAECLGGGDYAVRQTPCAIRLGENTSRVKFSHLIGHNAQIHGIFGTYVAGTANSNLLSVAQIEAAKCGSGHATDSHTGTVYAVTRYGTANSTSQFTAVSLGSFAELPPTALDLFDNGTSEFSGGILTPHSSPIFIKMADGDIYRVGHLDRVGGKVFVEGWVEDAAVSSTFTWIFGAGLCLSGADTNLWDIGTATAVNCAIGAALNHFYGPTISMLHMDAVEVGMTIGGGVANASFALMVGKAYFEGVETHILTTSIAANGEIYQTDGFDIEKVKTTFLARDASGVAYKQTAALAKVGVVSDGQRYSAKGAPANIISSSAAIKIGSAAQHDFHQDTITFNLEVVAGLNDATGGDSEIIEISGSGANNQPTGSITFAAPTGYTVNGAATAVFGSLSTPTQFKVRHDTGGTDLKVFKTVDKQSAAVADVAAAPTQAEFNGLLAALRSAGMMAP